MLPVCAAGDGDRRVSVLRSCRCEARAVHASASRGRIRGSYIMTTTIGPITLILDLRKQIARSREVLEELQRRVSELSPRISEEDALLILPLDMTFYYLKARKSLVD